MENDRYENIERLEPISFIKEDVEKLNKRDCYTDIVDFIKKSQGTSGRVICLHGLRRTGKTTLMKQLSMEVGGTIFQVKNGQNMNNVYATLSDEKNKGAKVVFIDEITFAEDFISNSALLADKYCGDGMDIVLAGTNSFALALAEKGQLFDRTMDVDMTYISYAEHVRVLNTADFDEYMMYGGLMRKGLIDKEAVVNVETLNTYLDGAVAGNIASSVKKADELSGFPELQERSLNDIKKGVTAMAEIYNGKLEKKMISEKIHVSVKGPIDDLLKPKNSARTTSTEKSQLLALDTKILVDDYKDRINMLVKLDKEATRDFADELKKCLRTLGVSTVVNIREFWRSNSESDEWTSEKLWEDYILPPALKYWLYTKGVDAYLNTNGIDDKLEATLSKQLRDDIFGRVAETTALIQTDRALNGHKYLVVKPRFLEGINLNSIGEYDMLVWDKENNVHWAFEVKHTPVPFLGSDEKMDDGQDKHLLNQDFLRKMVSAYGKREKNIVLYSGEVFESPSGTLYINISDYLRKIDETGDMRVTVAHFQAEAIKNRAEETTLDEIFTRFERRAAELAAHGRSAKDAISGAIDIECAGLYNIQRNGRELFLKQAFKNKGFSENKDLEKHIAKLGAELRTSKAKAKSRDDDFIGM